MNQLNDYQLKLLNDLGDKRISVEQLNSDVKELINLGYIETTYSLRITKLGKEICKPIPAVSEPSKQSLYAIKRVIYRVEDKEGYLVVANPDTHHKIVNGVKTGFYLLMPIYSKRKKYLEFSQSDVENINLFKECIDISKHPKRK